MGCVAARIGLGEERNAISAFLFTLPSGDTGAPAEKLPKASAHAQASQKRSQQCVHTYMLSPLLKDPPHLQNNLSWPGARRLWQKGCMILAVIKQLLEASLIGEPLPLSG